MEPWAKKVMEHEVNSSFYSKVSKLVLMNRILANMLPKIVLDPVVL
jgi:hypothetical protein